VFDADLGKATSIPAAVADPERVLDGDGTQWAAIRDADAVTRLAITNF
jgi:hypothetical protein